jgi:HTH-type transcriptional regulator/antitoxin HigA
LDRKRALTLAMIRRLHAQLGIPAEILVQPTRIERGARPKRRAAACRS